MGRLTQYPFSKTPLELTDSDNRLSSRAIVLYVWLCRIEQEYTPNPKKGEKVRDWFLFTDEQLVERTGMSIKTVKLAKKELKERGFIKVERGGWYYADTGKGSKRQPCKYYIVK